MSTASSSKTLFPQRSNVISLPLPRCIVSFLAFKELVTEKLCKALHLFLICFELLCTQSWFPLVLTSSTKVLQDADSFYNGRHNDQHAIHCLLPVLIFLAFLLALMESSEHLSELALILNGDPDPRVGQPMIKMSDR